MQQPLNQHPALFKCSGYIVHLELHTSSANITGFYNNVTPSGLIDQTLVNSGVNTETVTYHITPHANGCTGIRYDFLVTVFPSPDLATLPLNKQQCNNTSTNITLVFQCPRNIVHLDLYTHFSKYYRLL